MKLSSIFLKAGKFILRTIAIIIGIILAIVGYTIIRPISRVIGGIISAATFLLIVYWLITWI